MTVRTILAMIVGPLLFGLVASSASAEMSSEPAPVKTILDGAITINGIVTILTIIGASIGIITYFEKKRRQTEADARAMEERIKSDARDRDDRMMSEISKHQDTIEGRLKTVEITIRDFKPGTEIERMVAHEKAGREMADQGLKERLDLNTRDIVEIKVGVGRLEQQQAGTAATVERVEELVREQGRDNVARFDKLQDCLNTLSRRAPAP